MMFSLPVKTVRVQTVIDIEPGAANKNNNFYNRFLVNLVNRGCIHDDLIKCRSLGVNAALRVSHVFFLYNLQPKCLHDTISQKYCRLFRRSVAAVTGVLLLDFCLQFRNDIIRYSSETSAVDKLSLLYRSLCGLTFFFLYVYMSYAEKSLQRVSTQLKQLNHVDLAQDYGQYECDAVGHPAALLCLHRRCYIWLSLFIGAGLTSTIYHHTKQVVDAPSVLHAIKRILKGPIQHWSVIIADTHYAGIIGVELVRTFVDLASVSIEAVVIVLCMAVKSHIERFNFAATKWKEPQQKPCHDYVSGHNVKNNTVTERNEDTMHKNFVRLKGLVQDTCALVAPLLLFGYIYNVFITLMNLFLWINPRGGAEDKFVIEKLTYAIYFAVRIFLGTYFAANINQSLKFAASTFEEYPPTMYTKQVERLDRVLSKDNLGVYLCNTILITRMFFCSILSFMVSMLIILLQTSNS